MHEGVQVVKKEQTLGGTDGLWGRYAMESEENDQADKYEKAQGGVLN